ncbi:neuroendocrine convertase 1 [Trichonephila clavipes]|nr:neuroendocrine convertase 1 [Trichonephila clavipes]
MIVKCILELNKGQTGSAPDNDINVLPVWKSGITGKGVRISVLDDGIHPQSEEVAQNYDTTSSEDLSFKKSNYSPIPENSHGTYCAAIAAGVANNNVCGVGVAYEAKIGVAKVTDSWPAYHEFEPCTAEVSMCRRNMSRLKRLPVSVMWKLGERSAISGVALVTLPWFKITSPRAAE